MQDKEIIQQIKSRVNLVEIIGQLVKLRQQGNAWIGLCPFHSERTASFHVLPEKGYYRCFGCNKHGDAFDWLMEREGLSFYEAKEQLATIAGIVLPKTKVFHDPAKDELDTKIRSALEIAQSYFINRLKEDRHSQDYLQQRGIKEPFATQAGFGVAPDGWENVVNHLRKHGNSSELIEQTGLAIRTDRGSLIDFMRNRLTIPIHNARGNLVAFGGRALGDENPKYLNTRETHLFKKSETLFGFHTAKSHLREGALIVEGYFDVLQLHQEGIFQAVAPLGTSLTEAQLKLIAKYTKRIILCFDGDSAGQRATDRSLKIALPLGFDVRLLLLPSGEDPDTWCIKHGADGFQEMLRHAPDWVGFILDRARESRDIKKISDRMEIFQIFVEYYSFMSRTQENWILLQSIAADLSIPKHEFNRALNRYTEQNNNNHKQISTNHTEEIEVDELLKPLIILCQSDSSRLEINSQPASWWEYLNGAHLLQTLLDSDGDISLLSKEMLGAFRKLETTWTSKGSSGITLEKSLVNLEKAYLIREIDQLKKRQLSPEIFQNTESVERLEKHMTELLHRVSILRRNAIR